ncbi:MAG: hypothetical protein ACI4V4_02060 [Eubacterium sp.]
MKNSLKIPLSIITYLLSIVLFDCFYGFVISGYAGWLQLLLSVICGTVISFILAIFIFKRKNIKTEKFRIFLIVAMILFVSLARIIYNPLNKIASNDYISYETKIVRMQALYATFFFDPDFAIYVENQNGEEIEIDINSPIITYDEGDVITIKEIQGGFGYPIYEIVAD